MQTESEGVCMPVHHTLLLSVHLLHLCDMYVLRFTTAPFQYSSTVNPPRPRTRRGSDSSGCPAPCRLYQCSMVPMCYGHPIICESLCANMVLLPNTITWHIFCLLIAMLLYGCIQLGSVRRGPSYNATLPNHAVSARDRCLWCRSTAHRQWHNHCPVMKQLSRWPFLSNHDMHLTASTASFLSIPSAYLTRT